MATYAAYRHIELDNIGFGKKRVLKPPGGASSDIFGPSGSEQTTPEPRRNRAQQSSSLFFGDDDHSATNNKASNKPGNDSYQRLFGEVELPRTPVNKNRMKSSIILDQVDNKSSNTNIIVNGVKHTNGNTNSSTNSSISSPKSYPSTPINGNSPREGSGKASLYIPRNPVTGDGYGFVPVRPYFSARKKDGNPVTGEGYEKAVAAKPPSPSQLTNGNSIGSSASSQSGSAAPNNTNSGPIPSRQRVPPGGFSSGLW